MKPFALNPRSVSAKQLPASAAKQVTRKTLFRFGVMVWGILWLCITILSMPVFFVIGIVRKFFTKM